MSSSSLLDASALFLTQSLSSVSHWDDSSSSQETVSSQLDNDCTSAALLTSSKSLMSFSELLDEAVKVVGSYFQISSILS